MIHLIILAAGRSVRFGENKLLFTIEGRPMYRHMIDKALEFQEKCEEPVHLIVVTAYAEIADVLSKEHGFSTAWEKINKRQLMINNRPEDGISRSIRLGIRAAQAGPHDGLMFAVCDQPRLTCDDLLSVSRGFRQGGERIAALSAGGVPGNPVIFGQEFEGELLCLTGDTGGKSVLMRHREQVYLCEAANPLSLQDIDEKERGGIIP